MAPPLATCNQGCIQTNQNRRKKLSGREDVVANNAFSSGWSSLNNTLLYQEHCAMAPTYSNNTRITTFLFQLHNIIIFIISMIIFIINMDISSMFHHDDKVISFFLLLLDHYRKSDTKLYLPLCKCKI